MFSSKIVHGHTKTVLVGNYMYVMTQAPGKGEEPSLPHGLSMANTYTEITTRSRCVAVVMNNQTATPVIISKGVKVAWVVAVNSVPPVEFTHGTLGKLEEMQGI